MSHKNMNLPSEVTRIPPSLSAEVGSAGWPDKDAPHI